MRTKAVITAGLALALGASAASAQVLKSEDEKTLYALGLSVGQDLHRTFNLSKDELAIVERGLEDAVSGEQPRVELDRYGPKINELARKREAAVTQAQKKAGASYAAEAAKEHGAVRTRSGLVFIPGEEGSGPRPSAKDRVTVHYTGRLIDGTEFDSTRRRGEPAQFPLDQVIPCWTEALQRMKVGGEARLVCPSDLAYGDRGRVPRIPGGSTLVFDVELLGINAKR